MDLIDIIDYHNFSKVSSNRLQPTMNEQHIKAEKQNPPKKLATVPSTSTSKSKKSSLSSQNWHNLLDLRLVTRQVDCLNTFSPQHDANQDRPQETCMGMQSAEDENEVITAIIMSPFLEAPKQRSANDELSPVVADFSDSDDDSVDSISYYRRRGRLVNKKSNAQGCDALLITLPSIVPISGAGCNRSILPNQMSE